MKLAKQCLRGQRATWLALIDTTAALKQAPENNSSLLNKVHRNSARKMTLLSNYKHDAYTVQLMLKSGRW